MSRFNSLNGVKLAFFFSGLVFYPFNKKSQLVEGYEKDVFLVAVSCYSRSLSFMDCTVPEPLT